MVTAVTQPPIIRLFKSLCKEKKAPFWRVGKDVRYRSNGFRLNYYGFNRRLRGIELGLKGVFFCVLLWIGLLVGFTALELPSYWFTVAQALIDAVLVIIICGGDIRIR